MKFSIKKIIFFYFIFFIVLYFEDISIAGIRFAQLWKFPIYLYAFFFVIRNLSNNSTNRVLLLGILISLKLVFNINFGYGLLDDIAEALYSLSLPLSISFFYLKFKNNPEKLNTTLLILSTFFILSNIPFILDLLPQRNVIFELDRFGLTNKQALSGLFYQPNVSSKIMVVSFTIIYAYFLTFISSKKNKFGLILILILGLYAIYLCYTRTGWLLTVVGVLIISLHKENFVKVVFKVIPIFIIIGIMLFSYIVENEALLLRLRGGTTYRENVDIDLNILTSFRLDIYEKTIQSVNEEGLPSIIMGIGKKKATEKMSSFYGVGFIAHNRFIEIYQYGGLIALLFFVFFLINLFKLVKKIDITKKNYMSKLPYAILIIYIISIIPSHGLPIWGDFLFGGYIAYNLIKSRKRKLSITTAE